MIITLYFILRLSFIFPLTFQSRIGQCSVKFISRVCWIFEYSSDIMVLGKLERVDGHFYGQWKIILPDKIEEGRRR